MKTSLSSAAIRQVTARLSRANRKVATRYPGETGRRQPVHTVYGGAHLFRADIASRLGSLALRALEEYAPNPLVFAKAIGLPESLSDAPTGLAGAPGAPALTDRRAVIYARVMRKLEREPVEDFRIDFEDGYGNRPDAEEDADAAGAAGEVARGMSAGSLPPSVGIRIKPLTDEMGARSIRTLDLFVTTLLSETGGKLPADFVVTLPKITTPEQVTALARLFDMLESRTRLERGRLKMELMIETTQAILNDRGENSLPHLIEAARGRCVAAHFGTYDYTASCNITAAHQHMAHPACAFAKNMMQVALAGTGIWLSDGATNILPVPPHRAEKGKLTNKQAEENRAVVHHAWRLHYDHIQDSLATAFYQGWDLHPAQLPTRYAAVYQFFLGGLDAASERLQNFVVKAAQATIVGDVFDDAATGQGLLNYFLRAINCGAIQEEEAEQRSGLTLNELRSASFSRILQGRPK
jgi:citrate lyase beta subunit